MSTQRAIGNASAAVRAGGGEMIYAQIRSGQRLHLAYEAGEGKDDNRLVRSGFLSDPICGRKATDGYRMTCNLPLANACRACSRVWSSRYGPDS